MHEQKTRSHSFHTDVCEHPANLIRFASLSTFPKGEGFEGDLSPAFPLGEGGPQAG